MTTVESSEADYVIVGAGAAGCVLARRLSESGKHKVVVLEAGGPDRNIYIKIPAGFIKTVYDRSLNWNYETAPAPHANNRSIPYPRGKVLGGSSSINGHLYVRGQAHDYDTWAQLGCRGWSWSDLLPLFKRSERRVGGSDEVRGRDGELYVEDQRSPHPLCELFQASAEAIGLPRNPDYNSGDQEGTCVYQQMMRTGRRWSAADAFLKPALNRPNLKLVLHALAEQVILEGKRAVGVAYRVNGVAHEVRARREVILSGGSINSPQLLQLSGIGDPEWLKPHGIEVRHALNGVGRNLRDHYAARIACRVKNMTTLNERARGLPLVQEVIRYAFTRKGLLTSSPGHAGGFLRSRPDLAVPDIQLFFAPASYAGGKVGTSDLEREPGMTCGGYAARPESKGHVKLLSADPNKAPEIQTNYLADPLDQEITVAVLKFVRRMFAARPIADYIVEEVFPGKQVTDDQLLDHARATGSTTFHPIGSCKMGTDPGAVVDTSLKVVGMDGLRVVDGSIMPTMVSGNTYAACVVIGEKGADAILAAAA